MMAAAQSRDLYWQACLAGSVWRRAAKIGLTVGLIQVALNQGDHWLRHDVTAGVIAKSVLSPLLSFSIAFVSAAGTYVENLQRALLSHEEI